MASNLECKNCAFFYADYFDDELCKEETGHANRPYCHWESRSIYDVAPCDDDEDEYEEEIW